MTPFTSDIAIIGRKRQNNRKSERKSPKLPVKVMMSTQVGEYMPQLPGRKSFAIDVTMMTKRSNHMPAFTHMQTAKTIHRFARARRNQKICGETTLNVIINQ